MDCQTQLCPYPPSCQLDESLSTQTPAAYGGLLVRPAPLEPLCQSLYWPCSDAASLRVTSLLCSTPQKSSKWTRARSPPKGIESHGDPLQLKYGDCMCPSNSPSEDPQSLVSEGCAGRVFAALGAGR
mmetsp:Transcript_49321/g.88093  ORF Transcript_49321/g.88093 Transcript_49321/m.88093 type:complete len:127 (+) Transcript_49321:928-1308(+)